MSGWLTSLLWMVVSFFCGAIPWSVWLGRLFLQRDVRQYGDGNPGTTNVFRAGSKWLGLLVLMLDISRSAAPVGFAYYHLGIRGLAMVLIAFFEMLVLNDQSSDSTVVILEEMAAAHPKLRLLNGAPPPKGWVGKNWACAQLAEAAQGDVFYFTDADTVHQPHGARRAGGSEVNRERPEGSRPFGTL